MKYRGSGRLRAVWVLALLSFQGCGQPPGGSQALSEQVSAPVLVSEYNILQGIVVSSNNSPIAGAKVSLALWGSLKTAITTAQGVYRIVLSEEDYSKLPGFFYLNVEATAKASSVIAGKKQAPEGSSGESFPVVNAMMLNAESPQGKIITLMSGVEHLGDSNYNGSPNSQFQKPEASGTSAQYSFELGAGDLAMTDTIYLKLTIRGAENPDTFTINGRTGYYGPVSAPDGSANEALVPVKKEDLIEGINTVLITSVWDDYSETYDDFEYYDFQVVLALGCDVTGLTAAVAQGAMCPILPKPTITDIEPKLVFAGVQQSISGSDCENPPRFEPYTTEFMLVGTNLDPPGPADVTTDNPGVIVSGVVPTANDGRGLVGILTVLPSARSGPTMVTFNRLGKKATATITVEINGTQYLQRRLPALKFMGTWTTPTNSALQVIADRLTMGWNALMSQSSYVDLGLDVRVYDELCWSTYVGPAVIGGPSANTVGFAKPTDRLIHLWADEIDFEGVHSHLHMNLYHEGAHKLHHKTIGLYLSDPSLWYINVPLARATIFQTRWNAVVAASGFPAGCPYYPLFDDRTWGNGGGGRYVPRCGFASPYGASEEPLPFLTPEFHYEDIAEMAANVYFATDSGFYSSGDVLNAAVRPYYDQKIQLLKGYGFLP